jgi:hypothetical protein
LEERGGQSRLAGGRAEELVGAERGRSVAGGRTGSHLPRHVIPTLYALNPHLLS